MTRQPPGARLALVLVGIQDVLQLRRAGAALLHIVCELAVHLLHKLISRRTRQKLKFSARPSLPCADDLASADSAAHVRSGQRTRPSAVCALGSDRANHAHLINCHQVAIDVTLAVAPGAPPGQTQGRRPFHTRLAGLQARSTGHLGEGVCRTLLARVNAHRRLEAPRLARRALDARIRVALRAGAAHATLLERLVERLVLAWQHAVPPRTRLQLPHSATLHPLPHRKLHVRPAEAAPSRRTRQTRRRWRNGPCERVERVGALPAQSA
mmetsp:Transcript_22952/g.54356  ORF Transcript_22952/g.54356 Transcript_22952/m.54356 type:complete len:268 (-) Transcript_22952:5266-6069(-)